MARSRDELMPAMSARSVALSLLLGAVPPRLTAADLGRLAAHFGLAPATMRVALSRMVASGDALADGGAYTLAPRHLERQATTEALILDRRIPHTGRWRMIVATGGGRPADERQATRAVLEHGGYAPLREGVWMRPDNLAPALAAPDPSMLALAAEPDDEASIAVRLWDLDAWAAEARILLAALHAGETPMTRLRAAAAAVRHLVADPALPDALLPRDWPAEHLRRAYADYRDELREVASGRAPASVPERKEPA